MRPPQAYYGFRFVTKFKVFTVLIESNITHSEVKFILSDNSIQVRDGDNNLILDASLTLNDAGECRLLVKGQSERCGIP